jgi:peptide/nickel transport system substrate-binding protein
MLFSAAACGNNQQAANKAASSAPAVESQEATVEPTASSEPAATSEAAESAAPEPTGVIAELPRNETLYFGGQQWDSVKGWNPYSSNNNNALAVAGNASARLVMFETLYMYNLLDGSLNPLLASGQPEWNAERTELTVKMNPDAKWNDGTPVTAEDVAYTYASHLKYETAAGVSFGDFIDTIEAPDASTVVLKAKLIDGNAVNSYQLEDYICRQYVIQKAWTETLEARASSPDAFKDDPAEDVVSCGPYKKYYADDQKVVFIRDDNYWGVALWGSLPAPKYLAHAMYVDNAAQKVAFTNGDIDVNQQFISDIQNLWLQDGLPISAYMDEPPYGICVTMPSAWYNLKSPGLDQVVIRKAIAIAVDYDAINQNAMTGQSPTFAQTPRSLMNPTEGEQSMYDHDAVADLQWVGNDIDGANKLLDDAGIVDTDGDGIREFNGQNLEYNACCPEGWSDWQAAMEIVAAAGQKIGINIETNFPTWEIYQTVFTDGDQTEYDIFMYAGDGTGPTYPWRRVRERLSSEFIGQKNNWVGNFGGYSNARADEIIGAIPLETDPDTLKALYTEAVKIYLEEVPSFALMYRPELFHAVNESVWTGFPEAGDGDNIPPTDCTDGYGIAALYNLKLVS